MSKIYSIYTITNLITSDTYIGFTDNFIRRKAEHLREANYKRRNYPLYNAINKYGKSNFKWEIIFQSFDKDYTLLTVEPLLIKEYKSKYNITEGGEAPMLNKKHTQETILKMKARVPWNKGKPFSLESRKRMSEAQRARKPNPIQWRNQGISNSNYWLVTLPSGETIKLKGLKKFCKDNNLSSGNMSRLASGNIKYYKGYACVKLPKDCH
jgi:group I intron endonuclease